MDSETGECVSGMFYGVGQDSGDKGIWKAVTGAIKYIMTSTFLIPTGDDPEKDEGKEKKPAVEIEKILKLIASCKNPEQLLEIETKVSASKKYSAEDKETVKKAIAGKGQELLA